MKLKKVVGAAVLLLASTLPLRASEPLDMFDSEATALKHCGHDRVVWLDVPSHAFWLKGQRGYGTSKSGGYTCEKDAAKSGNHENRK
jgi:hypothetical protein